MLKKGFFWVFIDYFFVKGLSFVTNIILARLLLPEDFGLMGLISIVFLIVGTLIDSGFSSSLIRTQNVENIDYSTIFLTNIISSVFLYAILFFVAPFIADFYHQEVLTDILRVYGVAFIISAFYTIQNTILTKKIKFKKITLLNIPGVIINSIIGIYLAYNGYGVWSIVYSYISSCIVTFFMYNFFSEWKISFAFSKKVFYKHFSFGYKLLLTGILGNIFNNIYSLIIGRFFPIKSLGFYDRANTFAQYPSTVLIMTIGKVSFPILANYQNDRNLLKEKFKNIVLNATFVSVFCMLSISFWGDLFFIKILGQEWKTSAEYFPWFCYAAIFFPLNALNTNILKIVGKSGVILKMEILMKFIISGVVFISYFIGIEALVLSVLINTIILFLLNIYCVSNVIPYRFLEQLGDIMRILVLGGILFIFYNIFRYIYPDGVLSYYVMPIFTLFNGIIFMGVAKLLRYSQVDYFFKLIKN